MSAGFDPTILQRFSAPTVGLDDVAGRSVSLLHPKSTMTRYSLNAIVLETLVLSMCTSSIDALFFTDIENTKGAIQFISS